ncbi:MAG: hypothetical protein IT442_04245 [Phycisphaeraceae bacterium]|nr:hypothetical protein [Phycisphaeraceae bacterium]
MEVLGSLVLVATLLAGILAARANATRQAAVANRRLEAADAADQLLTRWWRLAGTQTASSSSPHASEPEPADEASMSFPRESSGRLEAQALRWQTHTIENREVEAIGGQVVRLEIFDDRSHANTPGSVPDTARPLITLDVVLPVKDSMEKEPANTPEREDKPDAGAQAMAWSSHGLGGRP